MIISSLHPVTTRSVTGALLTAVSGRNRVIVCKSRPILRYDTIADRPHKRKLLYDPRRMFKHNVINAF